MTLLLVVALALALLALGFEMLLVLGVTALSVKTLFYAALPDLVVIQKLLGGVNHTTLLAIPFFIFAAELMAAGQIARRLTDLADGLLGGARGGIGHATIGASLAFGSVSGSAPATVAALGGMVYPRLRAQRFTRRFSLGLIVSSAEIALLIPPSITLIIYGWMTGTSVARLFAAGLAIGFVLALAFAALVVWQARRAGLDAGSAKTSRRAALAAAGWALGMPLIILGGIYAGVFTPTEAAAVSVVYAILVEAVVYRTLGWQKLVDIAERSAVATGVIFVLLAFGALLAYFITLAQVPALLTALLADAGVGWVGFLLAVNLCFLLAGMFIDPNSALLILVPPLFPVAVALGIDPVHFGMVVTLNIAIGMITPPFGLDLFVAASTLDKPVTAVIAGVWPFVGANLAVLALVSYVPALSLLVPRLLFG